MLTCLPLFSYVINTTFLVVLHRYFCNVTSIGETIGVTVIFEVAFIGPEVMRVGVACVVVITLVTTSLVTTTLVSATLVVSVLICSLCCYGCL